MNLTFTIKSNAHYYINIRERKVMQLSIPGLVLKIIEELHMAGYEAYAAGNTVRDCLIGLEPEELKVITDAPAEMVGVLFDRVYPSRNDDGSMTVFSDQVPVRVICLGEWMTELRHYSFTVNGISFDPFTEQLVDPWDVSRSLNSGVGVIQAVGDPTARFQEDPRQLLEVFYLMKRFDDAGMEWHLEPETWDALVQCSSTIRTLPLKEVGKLIDRIIVGRRPALYFEEMRRSGLLKYILPELDDTYGIAENGQNIKDVFDHTMLVVQKIRPELHLRWAALLHDIGKPHCISYQGDRVHFYGHQVIGSVISRRILGRLKYSKEFIEKVSFLVFHHMYPTPRTKKAVLRFVNKIGLKNLGDLLELRRADIMGGKYKNLGRLEHFKKEIDAVLFELPPFSIKNLEVDGYDVMQVLGVKPGPIVGSALQFLFERVKENRDLNKREILIKMLKEEFGEIRK
jgi:putative nucleotidyltransferase with HDIG domain